LFAPSWLYRSHPETGADFAHQRLLLDRLGLANRLIVTGESASIEDNAAAIAAALRAARPEDGSLILVTASKSGAEAALALSRLLAPEDTARVVAWVNIVGALGGTPLADSALRPPISWLVRCVFWLNGWDWAGLTSMATRPSRDRLDGARLPESITVVNVVAVPLSGSVGATVWWGYRLLRPHGPNDGVVLLADAVWPGGVNIVAIGPDHLFAPRTDTRRASPCCAPSRSPCRSTLSRRNLPSRSGQARSATRRPLMTFAEAVASTTLWSEPHGDARSSLGRSPCPPSNRRPSSSLSA